MKRSDSKLPADGDVAYFEHLHLDTVQFTGDHSHRAGHRMFLVEGKPRPMLVMRCLPGRDRDRSWFIVLPITSKGYDERGKLLPNLERIGNCLDSSRESFVRIDAQRLPENMISRRDGSSPIVKPCDPFSVANAIKVLQYKVLGYRATTTKSTDS